MDETISRQQLFSLSLSASLARASGSNYRRTSFHSTILSATIRWSDLRNYTHDSIWPFKKEEIKSLRLRNMKILFFENLKWQNLDRAAAKKTSRAWTAEPRNSLTVENLWQRSELPVVCRFFFRALQTATRLGIWMEPSTRENLFEKGIKREILKHWLIVGWSSVASYSQKLFANLKENKKNFLCRNSFVENIFDRNLYLRWSLLSNETDSKAY